LFAAGEMNAPRISILLPSLNAREFLEERVDSLLRQTFTDWEAIVLDSHSNDGSWEFFQSVAEKDSRFQLHQLPREGLYAALNRGLELAKGEFVHVATCDDAGAPQFLATLLHAFTICPEAGIAASDVSLINSKGEKLTAADMVNFLQQETIDSMLSLDRVRSYPPIHQLNYRPPPHDCLLHFAAKSVYFSLTQLLIRTEVARSIAPFDTNVGSSADVGWLVRLTNIAGTVHVPERLAQWRFHGRQLTTQPNPIGFFHISNMLERALPFVCDRHRNLLRRSECAALLLPTKAYLARSKSKRIKFYIEATFRLAQLLWLKPAATIQASRMAGLKLGSVNLTTIKQSFIPMFVLRLGLAPCPYLSG
jgi:glycosyltransferase involved in cell wall biosynthesis